MSWSIVYSRHSLKDAKKLAQSNLRPKTEELLEILNPTHSRLHHRMRRWSVILKVRIPEGSTFNTDLCIKF